ncbi:MAG: hypothetical protein DHS80DRAFT_15610 [Piptocephalis tieghemiana]|nr:MAG: hypothetical protein DHS80DRAFT_15610 [Piptocephalis tieghemiana]
MAQGEVTSAVKPRVDTAQSDTSTKPSSSVSSPRTPSAPSSPQDLEPAPTLFGSPTILLQQFFLALVDRVHESLKYLLANVILLIAILSVGCLLLLLHVIPGPHSTALAWAESETTWASWWILLGVASSIGLGTGLHTFVLFLGPFIAEVTVAAYSCGNLDFAVRGGSDAFLCPTSIPVEALTPTTFWGILRKVQWEAFCWGLGTAIGELPPYFMARAAALSGDIDADLLAVEDLSRRPWAELTLKERFYLTVHSAMKRLGFLGIFLCASIPNPLFDLAGITCGHFLIPFSTFFGATLLGKAVVKSTIQSTFVILVFSRDAMDTLLQLLKEPLPSVHRFLEDLVLKQLSLFDPSSPSSAEDSMDKGAGSWVGFLWNGLIGVMMAYFALSIVESVGKTRWREEQKLLAQKVSKSM